ncbi:Cysteine protease required for autophagy - Apg4p/Aut2p [Handroanthus impetiginosus]|uniref:Cysteine protease n=1 Tax=Handroanthus impetiginosus TaxID=429701 RepID=A0A2G9HUN0_9LAMI|nr:Cysteine protease required for autophagy - Apg4p/Aut2p [Handroanthus impetiginosus]
MKGFPESNSDPSHNSSRKKLNLNNSSKKILGSVSSEAEPSIGCNKHQKSASSWSGIWPQSLSIFSNLSSSHTKSESKSCSSSCSIRKKSASGKNYYERWRAAVRRVMMNGGSMRRILGFNRTSTSTSNSDIWLLGICYCVAQEGDDVNSSNPTQSEGFAAFVEDFSSRILITYRKGFAPIGDTKYTSDVNWGCMLRSSQMLVAQGFLFHKLGRSWRKCTDKPLDQSYIEILHLFGDSEDSPCSIHNLLQAGKAYGLAPGSWVGPYAMCRTWESLMWSTGSGVLSSAMALYVVSGDEDGERGGAPVLCIEDVSRHCSEFSGGRADWAPLILMVPLVLGLEKVNPRYLPLLIATFTFPQSLGILGGRPGASTYILGVQDENAFYLDPHEVQQVVDIKRDNVDVDTSSYHCNVVRHISLDSIDPSLAIGFYCQDKSDFDDFCIRASELIDQSNGAPLFTIAQTRSSPKPADNHNATEARDCDPIDGLPDDGAENCGQEDDWQLL